MFLVSFIQFLVIAGKNIEFITAGGRVSNSTTSLPHRSTILYLCNPLVCTLSIRLQPTPQLQKLSGTQSNKKVVASPGQVSEDGDAKEARVEGEDDDNLKPRTRVATFWAARG